MKLTNYMAQKLKEHIGHHISCVRYGSADDPDDICIECDDCYEVLVSAEDFENDEFEDEDEED